MTEIGDNAVSALINAVRVYPCLYDKKDEKYHHSKAKEKLWAKIAEEISIKDGDAARAKWRNLKDCYLKYKRANSGGPGTNIRWLKTYRSWRWANHLAFLDPYVGTMLNGRFRRQLGKSKDSTEATAPDQGAEDDVPLTYLGQTQPYAEEVDVEMNPGQICPDSVENTTDSTYHLFMSYVETFRKLSPRRQAMLKVDLAQLFAAAEMEQIQENQEETHRVFVKTEMEHNQN